jgi:hypothetical protein
MEEVIAEQKELFKCAQMNAYGETAFNSYQAYKIFDGLNSSIYEGEFKQPPNKIETRFMDSQRIQFEYILKHTDIHSEVLAIEVNPERLKFGQHGQIGSRNIPLEKQNLEDLSFDPTLLDTENLDEYEKEDGEQELTSHEAFAGYSLAYLKFVSKMISLLDKKDTFTLSYENRPFALGRNCLSAKLYREFAILSHVEIEIFEKIFKI